MSNREGSFDPEGFDRLAAATVPGYAALQDLVALGAATGAAAAPRVLDVGCGTGTGMLALARALPRATLVGCDPALPMVTAARARCAAAGIEARVEHGPLEALRDEPAFDIVVSTLVLHFIAAEQRGAWLRAVRARLRPGGTLVLTALTRDAQAGVEPMWAQLRRDYASLQGFPPEELARRQAVTSTQTQPVLESELHALLAEAGFRPAVPLYQLLAVRCWRIEAPEAQTDEAARA